MNPQQAGQLLNDAVKAFENETDLKIKIVKKELNEKDLMVDGLVELPNKAGRLAVEIKKWAQHVNIGALANQIKNLPVAGILVADYVNPNMAEKLRELDIEFIDTAGNAFINKPTLHIWVTANKIEKQIKESKAARNRAFDATGLKIVFGFLCNPDLVNATYREIAEQTKVALGTVGWVINDLNTAGFLKTRGNTKDRHLINQKKLIERWVEAYPEKLQPKLKIGDFVAETPHWWKEITINNYGGYWGGEIAANKYTKYLKPKVATVYLPEAKARQLLAQAKLRKANDFLVNENVVKIYKLFWNTANKNQDNPDVVHPLLAYADLVATGDSRNLEAAREIYEQYIAEHIGQD